MTSEIRVLLCDDSSVMRRLLRATMQSEPCLNVVFEAENGLDAVKNVTRVKPDVIIMDVEMPIMDGVDAVREIRKLSRSVPIIMFSSLTSRGAEASLDAIEAGASDFATKPVGAGHITKAMASVRRDLIPKVLQWSRRGALEQPVPFKYEPRPSENSSPAVSNGAATQPSAAPGAAKASFSSRTSNAISAIGVGVSTGGPQALAKLLTGLPKDLPVPVLIVQHMPPVFTGLLADRLASQTGHQVREATDGDELKPGTVLLAPGDYHMRVSSDKTNFCVRLDQGPAENSCRPAVDPLFTSIAESYGDHGLGIILTGMGQDGAFGAKRLRECGGLVFAQDQESSVVWGMPGQVVKAGLANKVFSIDQMADEVTRLVLAGQPASIT
ncbi:chemotaxis response regulator protein-glutamate methylesterase [Stieleria sp. JC731]|uniref:protein-glutamate methylesterase/protein-glutamine glutaminase n=1 Tax=Pirellulaceae TaxID=2691357 RepID=UPI001E3B3209|nr:chemotaxis response regulator protein-glutamate methylesterase [Stieleria sp. JC731]MCC9600504.1 chemotaxis response regulator protein-glutamate methylesterase [Stieleria sp. JC731]